MPELWSSTQCVPMRPHWPCRAVRAAPIEAACVAGDAHAVHVLNNWVIPSHGVAVRAYLKPGSAPNVLPPVLGAEVRVCSVAISRKAMALAKGHQRLHFLGLRA